MPSSTGSVQDLAFRDMYEIFPRDVVEVCRQATARSSEAQGQAYGRVGAHASGEQRLIAITKPQHCVGTGPYPGCVLGGRYHGTETSRRSAQGERSELPPLLRVDDGHHGCRYAEARVFLRMRGAGQTGVLRRRTGRHASAVTGLAPRTATKPKSSSPTCSGANGTIVHCH
jgi:hypothetical protein